MGITIQGVSGITNTKFGSRIPAGIPTLDELFASVRYGGNDALKTVETGVNILDHGGLTIIKQTNQSGQYANWFATGIDHSKNIVPGLNALRTNNYNFEHTKTGFQVNTANYDINRSAHGHSTHSFRKAEKFFDIVYYTGTGTSTGIPHSLGSIPGMVFVKNLTNPGTMYAFNDELGHNKNGNMHTYQATAFSNSTGFWGVQENSTASTFAVGNSAINTAGNQYVAFVFAGSQRDTVLNPNIQAGSWVSNGSTHSVNLGWKPSWILFNDYRKGGAGWYTVAKDANPNGISSTSSTYYYMQGNYTPGTLGGLIEATDTGFNLLHSSLNSADRGYVYLAVRDIDA